MDPSPSLPLASRLEGRGGLALAVVLVAALALAPLAALLWYALGDGLPQLALGASGWRQLAGTLGLLLGVGGGGALLGTTTGWLTASCSFPGRRWLRIAQLLPLACPAYLLAATLVDLGSRWSHPVHGMGWAGLVLTLSTYSYVFLLSTESFSIAGRRQLEACRNLGVGPWGSFGRVALPMALPSIGAGLALAGMEVVNELGAVELLGVPTLSAGILQRWQAEGNAPAAVGLALVTLAIVGLLVAAERHLRRRSRCWNLGGSRDVGCRWSLRGGRALAAQVITLLPPLISLGVPLLWAALSLDQLASQPLQDLLTLAGRSLGLALVAAALTGAAALLLALAKRWFSSRLLQRLSFLAGLGYAMPGTVIALALMLVGTPLQLGPLLLLLWGYSDRFLAVAKGGLDAALERIPPSVDEAATGLGLRWPAVLRRVHMPLLRGPLLVGGLLVFVDTVKELPLTFALRPFDTDTLSVRVFQYAGDERLGAALVPALLILTLGLAAALALVPSLEQREP